MADVSPKPGSPQWWVRRLDRDLSRRKPTMERWDRYYDGDHPLVFATERFKEAFGGQFKELADNWMALVVDSVEERLNVEGFRFAAGDDGSMSADGDAWYLWQANNLDADSGLAHTEALVCSSAYALVDPTVSVAERVGKDVPLVTIEHPTEMIVATSPERRRERTAALKRWVDDDGRHLATLYLPDTVFKLERYRGSWRPRDGAKAEVANPFGVVPVVPLTNRTRLLGPGKAEHANVIPLQDAVNKLVADMIVASEFAAFFQRWATGIDVPLDTAGAPVAPFDVGLDKLLWNSNPEARFGAFPAADLGNYVKAIELAIQHIASQSRTPPHYLLGQAGSFPSGEALALDTLVPTPTGYTTMADIAVGDEVFDETGTVQTVSDVFAVMEGRPCYEVTFDDGTVIVADGAHKWKTSHLRRVAATGGDRSTGVVSTAEIAATIRTTNMGSGRNRNSRGQAHHRIPTSGPLDKADVELPVEPYVLGVWLGDGCSYNGSITQHVDDVEEMADLLRAAGETVSVRYPPEKAALITVRRPQQDACSRGHDRPDRLCAVCQHLGYRQRTYGEPMPPETNIALRGRLSRLGLTQNKHIPAAYMHASAKQRLALLQGLMDTDGNVSGPSVEFTNHTEGLARQVHELIQSLGDKAVLRSRPATFQGRIVGTQWRLSWTPSDIVFRLSRKASRQAVRSPGGKAAHRYIVSVEPCESVPVRCIAVSGPSHLFLVTQACIATHNSLRSTETGLVAKVRRRQRSFEEAWEEVIRLCFAAMGDPRSQAVEAETVWRDPESRTESEHIDALSKLRALEVPVQQLWEDAGYSPQQIGRFRTMNAQDLLSAALAATQETPEPAEGPVEAATGGGET